MNVKYTDNAGAESPTIGALAEQLKAIQAKEGVITPRAVVATASDPGSPLHSQFEWNDVKAGEQWRLQQARHLIASVFIVNTDTDHPVPVRAFVNLSPERGDSLIENRGYVYTPSINGHQGYQAQIIEYARDQLEGWKRRFGHLEEFFAVTRAIDETLSRAQSSEKSENHPTP